MLFLPKFTVLFLLVLAIVGVHARKHIPPPRPSNPLSSGPPATGITAPHTTSAANTSAGKPPTSHIPPPKSTSQPEPSSSSHPPPPPPPPPPSLPASSTTTEPVLSAPAGTTLVVPSQSYRGGATGMGTASLPPLESPAATDSSNAMRSFTARNDLGAAIVTVVAVMLGFGFGL